MSFTPTFTPTFTPDGSTGGLGPGGGSGMLGPIPSPFGLLKNPTPPVPGNGYEVVVRSGSDFYTLLCVLPRWVSVDFAVLLNNTGSGTITIVGDDPIWSSTLADGSPGTLLVDDECLWQVLQNGKVVCEFIGETVTEQLLDPSEDRVVQVTGPGALTTLGWARVMPEGFPDSMVFKTDAIADGFSETDSNGNPALDTVLWNQSTPSNRLALDPLGTVQLTASPSTTFLGAGTYDITDSVISAQVAPMQGGDGSQLTQMYVQSVNDPDDYALIGLSATAFYFQLGDQGNGTSQTKRHHNYSADADAFWQITEVGGNFYFWTSADGQTWTKHWQVPHGWDATQMNVFFTAKYDVDSSLIVNISNVNANVITPTSAGPLFLSTPIMGIFTQLLAAAQARGTCGFITTGRLGGATDAFGNPWTDVQSTQAALGTDLLSLLQTCAAVVNADFIMQPGFVLQVGLPVSLASGVSLGVDRSRQVVVREGAQERTKQRIRARDQIANLIGGVNADGTVVIGADAASIATWQQREGWVQTAAQVDASSMGVVVEASLAEAKDETLSWTLTILPSKLGAVPFEDFNVGDWIGAERPGGHSGTSVTDVVRVIGISMGIDTDGAAGCELTLSSYRQWMDEQLQYLINKFGGQFINPLGATPVINTAAQANGLPVVVAPGLGALANVAIG